MEEQRSFLQIHLNDLEQISAKAYKDVLLNDIHLNIINYLIWKYNSMSIGVSLHDINKYLDYDCFRELDTLVRIGLVKRYEHHILGELHVIVKDNLQHCR